MKKALFITLTMAMMASFSTTAFAGGTCNSKGRDANTKVQASQRVLAALNTTSQKNTSRKVAGPRSKVR